MFLTCACTTPQMHTIKSILCFIENYPVSVGVITSVIVGSFWLRKFLKQKQAEAFFGFYARLSLQLKVLQTSLEENERLNTSEPKAGNIYTLIYEQNYTKIVCPGFSEISSEELETYQTAAIDIKNTLLETENNVYPPRAKREKWYSSQQILFSFCEFLNNTGYQHITNEQFAQGEKEPKHIIKCKDLVNAINYIQDSIKRAKY